MSLCVATNFDEIILCLKSYQSDNGKVLFMSTKSAVVAYVKKLLCAFMDITVSSVPQYFSQFGLCVQNPQSNWSRIPVALLGLHSEEAIFSTKDEAALVVVSPWLISHKLKECTSAEPQGELVFFSICSMFLNDMELLIRINYLRESQWNITPMTRSNTLWISIDAFWCFDADGFNIHCLGFIYE